MNLLSDTSVSTIPEYKSLGPCNLFYFLLPGFDSERISVGCSFWVPSDLCNYIFVVSLDAAPGLVAVPFSEKEEGLPALRTSSA